MCARFHFTRGASEILLLGMLLGCPILARAQDAPPGAAGRIEGKDVSVESGTPARGGAAATAPSIYVANGSIVTVHSGQARMTLFAGGEVDICGPAKFTVLLSGDAVTLALNFGRVRVQLPAKTSLRIFTPTIIGTPIDINGGSRDVTVGLNLDDSLCVVAASGAIQLEHQFTGEKLIVPQAGEFFLNAGRLLPVAGSPGGCACPDTTPHVVPAAPAPPAPAPEFAVAALPRTAPDAKPDSPATDAAPEASMEFVIPAHANEAHPRVPSAKDVSPGDPPVSAVVQTTVFNALTFVAGSPARPPDRGPDILLLVREARIAPEWEFSGHVAAPGFAQEMRHALGENVSSPKTQAAAPDQPAAKPAKKKGGFWASLKRAFGGGEAQN
ncbi:MAG: hypothetical protein LAN36_07475 [Acidobacteriia bacterium]|nr:hypothetical protein [Terriglobia bacterium]